MLLHGNTPKSNYNLTYTHAWKKYPPTQLSMLAHTHETGENTHTRPPQFATPRPEQDVSEQGINSWAKYWDDSSSQYYYHNDTTGATSFERPVDFYTPRPGQKAIEQGDYNWAKYYDDASGSFYYHNESSGQTTYDRPREYATPRGE